MKNQIEFFVADDYQTGNPLENLPVKGHYELGDVEVVGDFGDDEGFAIDAADVGKTIAAVVDDKNYYKEKIKVIGVGGGGNNAIRHLLTDEDYNNTVGKNVEHWVFNTDQHDLDKSPADPQFRLTLGRDKLGGRGAGGNIHVGFEACRESEEEIKNIIEGTDLLFITAGLGGGTGTLSIGEIARIAKKCKSAPTIIAVVTYPSPAERRDAQAMAGLRYLRQNVNAYIIVRNEEVGKQMQIASRSEVWFGAHKVLCDAIKGIIYIAYSKEHEEDTVINADFADIKTCLRDANLTNIVSIELNSKDKILDAFGKTDDKEAKAISEEQISRVVDEVIRRINDFPVTVGENISRAKSFLFHFTYSRHIPYQLIEHLHQRIAGDEQEYVEQDFSLLDEIDDFDPLQIEGDSLSVKKFFGESVFATEKNPRLRVILIAAGLSSKPEAQIKKEEQAKRLAQIEAEFDALSDDDEFLQAAIDYIGEVEGSEARIKNTIKRQLDSKKITYSEQEITDQLEKYIESLSNLLADVGEDGELEEA